MPDSRDPYADALEHAVQRLEREVAQLREEVKDERGMKRGYRRLLIECLRRARDCPVCNPPREE